MINHHRGERIVAVVPEVFCDQAVSCVSRTSIVCVYIEGVSGIRAVALYDYTPDMRALLDIGATVCKALKNAVPAEEKR